MRKAHDLDCCDFTVSTEVLQRRDERLRLLGPMVSRMQAEFQGPLIERGLRIPERRSRLRTCPHWSRLRFEYRSFRRASTGVQSERRARHGG